MNIQGWGEIAVTLGLAVMLGWPIGIYMSRVWNGERTWLDPMLKPVEAVFYGAAGVDPKRSQGWLAYAGALLAFNLAGFVLLYAILRLQGLLPLSPQGFAGVSPHLASTPPSALSPTPTGRAMAGRRRCRPSAKWSG